MIDEPLITIQDGSFELGRKAPILKKINLKIRLGERIGIVGHNGAGKSTLMSILAGIKKLSQGKITYAHFKEYDLKDRIGFQFQAHDFPPGIKLKSLFAFYLLVNNLKANDAYVKKLLHEFEIKSLLKQKLKKLSGGQKQKVNIVFALINNPKVLFIDEVLTGLDISSQGKVLSLIEHHIQNNPQLTIVSVSHNEIELQKITNRIIVLKDGAIINDVPINQLIKKYGSISSYMEKWGKND